MTSLNSFVTSQIIPERAIYIFLIVLYLTLLINLVPQENYNLTANGMFIQLCSVIKTLYLASVQTIYMVTAENADGVNMEILTWLVRVYLYILSSRLRRDLQALKNQLKIRLCFPSWKEEGQFSQSCEHPPYQKKCQGRKRGRQGQEWLVKAYKGK